MSDWFWGEWEEQDELKTRRLIFLVLFVAFAAALAVGALWHASSELKLEELATSKYEGRPVGQNVLAPGATKLFEGNEPLLAQDESKIYLYVPATEAGEAAIESTRTIPETRDYIVYVEREEVESPDARTFQLKLPAESLDEIDTLTIIEGESRIAVEKQE